MAITQSQSGKLDALPVIQLTVLGSNPQLPIHSITILTCPALRRLAEPIAFTSIIAYAFPMMIDFNNGSAENASFYAGILISTFAISEALTAMFRGSISDKIGRKPTLLFGLAGTMLSNMPTGFACNFWMALGARVLGGLLNGNIAVVQTMLADIMTRLEHERESL
jgi:MFS family permease